MNIDVANYIGAVTREVEGRDHEGKPARVVVASRGYDTTPDDLWDALTSAERIPRWFLPVTGDLKLGGRYQLQGNAGGTITACEPPRRLSVTWEFGGGVTWVNVSLAAEGEGTRLELEHIAHIADPDEFWDRFGPGAVGVGWDLTLVGLALHLASRAAVDPAEVAAWSASDDGKAFAAQSSDGWRRASIAYGTDETAANAAAAETTKFYQGG
ncbi:MAG: Aha1 protein [Phenylobacterium sp.]|nr:Aha1 protein [Phenylobacterium sp.]